MGNQHSLERYIRCGSLAILTEAPAAEHALRCRHALSVPLRPRQSGKFSPCALLCSVIKYTIRIGRHAPFRMLLRIKIGALWIRRYAPPRLPRRVKIRRQTNCAGMMELADMRDLGSRALALGFKSPCPHQKVSSEKRRRLFYNSAHKPRAYRAPKSTC